MSADPVPVLIPLLNPNEPEAILTAVLVVEGQPVAPGDLLCALETTKSAADLAAEVEGYVVGLRFLPGDTVQAGQVFCYLAASPADPAPAAGPQAEPQVNTTEGEIPPGLRITRPALEVARSTGLDLGRLPVGPLITESQVRSFLEKSTGLDFAPQPGPFDPTTILVYGGGGHGKSLIDLLRALGTYHILGVVDDGMRSGDLILGVHVLGGGEVLPQLRAGGVALAVNAVGGIGNVSVRVKVFRRLAEAGFACPAVVHPTAFVEPSAALSSGVQVFPHAYVGSEVGVGFGSIINTGAIVSHDCRLGEYANISPGAMLAGGAQIGPGALVGMGATVNLQVRIGAGARVGNGATVKADVLERGVVRAGSVWPE